MTLRCTDPDMQLALLESECAGEPAEPRVLAHAESCEACRRAAERLRRMASVWVADQISDAEIASAELHFAARRYRPAGPSWRDPVPFAALGAILGLGLLCLGRSAGTHHGAASRSAMVAPVSDRSLAHEVSQVPASAIEGASQSEPRTTLAAPHIESARGVLALTDGVTVELKEGETAQVALADGHSTVLRGPCRVEFWSYPSEVGGWRLAYRTPTASAAATIGSGGEVPPEAPAAATSAERGSVATPRNALPTEPARVHDTAGSSGERAWARAAEALRTDDFVAADRAFSELGHAPDPGTRDAARLARAQLWMAHGRSAAVRPVLQDLAATGATALVRERAAEFLARAAP